MNFSSIKSMITSKAGRQVLTLQKHSPAILFGVGVVGVVGTAVLTAKATLKVEEVLDHHAKTMVGIETIVHDDYTEDDRSRDKVLLYARTAGTLGRMYGPALVVGVTSIACLTSSHVILSNRNAGLAAAYMALEKGFNKYRERVVEDLGEEKDQEFRYGYEEVVIVDDKGKPTASRRAIGEPSIYARLWDESSTSWNHNPDYNMVFLKAQQQFLNDRLQAHGHVFLNEVYDALGLDRTPAGQIVGWVKNNGDSYIDFGIFNDAMQPEHLAFFTGREASIWLDFNVDGPVYQLI